MFKLLLSVHIAAGIAAILLGAIAVAARKGARAHVIAGNWFAGSMIVLGITASILEPFRTPQPGSPVTGLFVCYFVATSWVAARRRDGTTGWFEILASIAALGTAGLMIWAGLTGKSSTPVGSGPVFILAALCLTAGLLDLRVVLRRKISAAERIRRHLWRMCFAFFIATGSFFLGQQKVMPVEVRGSPILFVLAFAPFAVMAFWLVRLRFAKAIARLSLRRAPGRAAEAEAVQ
ncbi:MAG TPA: hypothetical protein VF079_06440 [Sphingomicrobium sp.]